MASHAHVWKALKVPCVRPTTMTAPLTHVGMEAPALYVSSTTYKHHIIVIVCRILQGSTGINISVYVHTHTCWTNFICACCVSGLGKWLPV